MQKRIAISIGDINGIGPEVVLKTLTNYPSEEVTPIILSSSSVLEYYLDTCDINDIEYHKTPNAGHIIDGTINLLESYGDKQISITPGEFTKQSGTCAMLAVEQGLQLCTSGQADALVTAPISKEAVNLAGYHIPGHTEFLADYTGTDDFMMMLVHDNLRVGLVSIHIPLTKVASAITKETVRKKILVMHTSLQNDFAIDKPRIAVLGLNPHAGDGGVIGTEEQEIISPVIEQVQSKGLEVLGPYPADGFFGNKKYAQFDGILAMYHDQGLVPFKTLSFGGGVNFTAGLPIVRTSPDHGTAFDIAGQNKADPSSFREAFTLAGQLVENRKQRSLQS
ncbi:MAG: 4-hydroxythreonine-4-phosphate dehydrogenase PdxA [Bacteroidota bacterium]